MLTHKQKWRRVRRASRKSTSTAGDDSAADAVVGGVPNSINSLSIGDSLLQLLGTKAGSSRKGGTPSKDAKGVRDGAYCAVGGAIPVGTYSIGKVSFNQRVRVVLIPTRPELASIKADLWWEDQDYANFRREYILFVRATGNPVADDPTTSSPAAERGDAPPLDYYAEEREESRSGKVVHVDMKDDGESFPSPASLPLPQLSLNAAGESTSIIPENAGGFRSSTSRGVVVDEASTVAAASFTAGDCETAAAAAVLSSLTQQQQCHGVGAAGVTALGVVAGCGVAISGDLLVGGVGATGAGPREEASEGQDVEKKEEKQPTTVMLSGGPPLSPHGPRLPSTALATPVAHVTARGDDACGDGVTPRTQSLSSISVETDPESFSDCDEGDGTVVGRDVSPGCDGSFEALGYTPLGERRGMERVENL